MPVSVELRALLEELEAAGQTADDQPAPSPWAFWRVPPSRGVALLPAIRRAIQKVEAK